VEQYDVSCHAGLLEGDRSPTYRAATPALGPGEDYTPGSSGRTAAPVNRSVGIRSFDVAGDFDEG